MNFTVANHASLTTVDGYVNYNDVEFDDIPEMVTSGFNYVACKLKDEVRKDNNFDGYVDVLIIDIDANCTIEQAKALFAKYKFYLITSKSHQKEKNGIVCDRFRMFFRLDKTIHIRQAMEEIYSQFIKIYPFIDTSCRNVSRLYYSSPRNAIVFYNEGCMYPTFILSRVEATKTTKPISEVRLDEIFVYSELKECWINKYGEILVSENSSELNKDAKLKGALTILNNEFYAGNRANCLFKVASMLKNDKLSDDIIVPFLLRENDNRDGLKFREAMHNIASGVKRNG